MKKAILVLLVIGLGLYGCAAKQENQCQMPASDWAGTYVGTLPCADCEGIRTSLTIRTDQTYTLVSDYLGREEYRFEEKGQFAWIKEGEVIELRGDNQRSLYRVGKNTLTMLNSDGEAATGPMAEMYILRKEPGLSSSSGILNTKWRLTELMGEPVSSNPEGKHPYIHLNPAAKSFSGFGGCNMMNGSYEMKMEKHIRFMDMASTLKACPDMNHKELKFFEVLSMAETYVHDGQSLTLHKKNQAAALAKFTAVSGQ